MNQGIRTNRATTFKATSQKTSMKQPVEVNAVQNRLISRSRPTLFTIPISTEVALMTLLLPAIAAQSVQEAAEGTPTPTPWIDTAVASIIARELIEGAMFVTSHFGAILKNTHLAAEQKNHYMKALVPGLVFGVCTGGIISVAVGFGFSKAVENLDSVKSGVEIGEGISKALGAYFVGKLSLKIPKWFGISHAPTAVVHSDIENHVAETEGVPVENDLESPLAMASSLFWNTLRETAEGGIFTAISALLSKNSMDNLGASVGVGVGSAVVVGGGVALGAKYVSPRVFGIGASTVAGLLAVGLLTGAAHSAEEIYGDYNGGVSTPVIYNFKGTPTGYTLTTLGFTGISSKWTVLQLITWIVSAATLVGLHYWKNLPIRKE